MRYIIAVLALAAFVSFGSANAQSVTTTATRLDQTNSPLTPGSWGCVRIDITVHPQRNRAIRDVHLCVGVTRHTADSDESVGDPRNGQYTGSLPAGWNYDGVVATAADARGVQRWYATWTNRNPMAAQTVFSVTYCGGKNIVRNKKESRVILTNDGDLNPDTGVIGRFPGHAPEAK